MKSYKLYIFDFDDTLVNTFRDVTKIHYPVLAERLGIRYHGDEIVKANWGRDLTSSLSAVFEGEAGSEKMLSVLNQIHKEYPIAPTDGALEILKVLKKHDKFVSILTSGMLSIVQLGIQNSLGMKTDDFDYIYSTFEHMTQKPSPEILPHIKTKYQKARKIPIENKEIIYIGDSISDYLTAKNHGVDFVAVTTGVHSKEDFLRVGLSDEWIFNCLKQAVVPPESHGIVALIQNDVGEYLLLKEARKDNPYYGGWAGPHGRCLPDDILEEETVVRETLEECGLEVKPIRRVYERPADTKVKTVTFWEAIVLNGINNAHIASTKEVAEIKWASLQEIRSGVLKLYPGTKDYFSNQPSSF